MKLDRTDQAILTELIVEICGGEPSEVIQAGTPPAGTKVVAYNPVLSEGLGGVAAGAGHLGAGAGQAGAQHAFDIFSSPPRVVTITV